MADPLYDDNGVSLKGAPNGYAGLDAQGLVPVAQLPAGLPAADPSYSPGSFTVATETWKILGNHVKLTTTQRATISGTGRLRISN